MKQLKRRLFEIIQLGYKEDRLSCACDYLIVLAIIANLAVLVINTFEISEKIQIYLDTVEAATVVIFVVEYILRIITVLHIFIRNAKAFRFIFFIKKA